MNVYDFDKTIFGGDSTQAFYLFCLKRHPRLVFFVPSVVCAGLGCALGLMGLEAFKERFYMSLLSKINDIDAEVEKFWDTHRCRLKTWYLQQREDSDLIISASPEFLLAPICVELNISLIASKVDAKTGRLKGKNCKGSEKVSAFRQLYPTESIEQFYSDSRTDQPLADIAQQSFMVTGDKVLPWPSEANR